MTPARVALLTGPIGAGKTTAAGRVAELARRQGVTCGGLLAPAMLDGTGAKVGIWGVDLLSGERRPLARCDPAPSEPGPGGGDRRPGSVPVGRYSFDADALAWSVRVIETAVGVCDLVFVDEIGKLELWQGAGLAPVLPRLAAGQGRWLVVVRDFLLAELRARLEPLAPTVWGVTAPHRDELPGLILAQIMSHNYTRQGG